MNPVLQTAAAAAMLNAPTFSVGKNMDHPHFKGRFTLRIWVPIEQIPILMGKGREIIHGIKRKTHVKSIECPAVEPGKLWAPVVIIGDPTTSFKAYEAIHSVVDEVDTTAIAEFPLHIRRHAIVVGSRGSTLKRISADNAVRIFVPYSRQGRGWGGSGEGCSGGGGGGGGGEDCSKPDKNNIQLEGDVKPIFSALAMIIEAVYGFRATTLVGTFPPQAAAPLPGNANHLNTNTTSNVNNHINSASTSAAAVRATDAPAAAPLSAPPSSSSGALSAQLPSSSSPNVNGATRRPPQAVAREGSGGGSSVSTTTAAASTVATVSTTPVVSSSGVSRVYLPSASAASARGLPASIVGAVKAQGKSPAGNGNNDQRKQQQQQKHQRWSNSGESAMSRSGANVPVVTAPSPAAAPQAPAPASTPAASGASADGWGGTGEYHPSPRAAITAARESLSAAPHDSSRKQEEDEKRKASKDRGRSCSDPAIDAASSSKAAEGQTTAVAVAELAPERAQTHGKASLGNSRPPTQARQQKQQEEVSVPSRRGQGQGHAMIEPIPGPLPSAEQSEETLRLPTRVVSVLQGHHHGKYRAVHVGSFKDAAKWSILKDILKHTGTKLVAVSLFTPSQNTSSEPNSSATASSATDKASSSAGPAEKQELTSGKDKGSLKNGTEPLLEISIKGPTNCVEVAVEALRRLGRGDTVRDALNLVKKTSPHRRLNHQRRQQEQELREKEDRSQPKPEKYNGEKGGSDRKPGAMSGSNQAQPSAGNGAVAAPAPASTLSRKPVKEASARSGEGGVPGGRKTSNGGDGSGNRGTNSAGQGQNGGDKEHVDEASSTRGNDDGQRHLKTEESRDGGGGPSGRPVESGGSREGSGGSGNRGRVGGTNEQSVAGESNGSQDRQPQPEASKLSQAVTEQGGSKQGSVTKVPSSNRPPRKRKSGGPRSSRAGSAGRGGRGRGESGGGRGGGGTTSSGAGGNGLDTA